MEVLEVKEENDPHNISNIKIWGLVDVVAVFGIAILILALETAILFLVLGNLDRVLSIVHVSSIISVGFIPIIWVKKKYEVSSSTLGLGHGKISIISSLLFGIITAFVFIISPVSGGIRAISSLLSFSYVHVFLNKLNLEFIATVILTPILEELYFRGFLYGYLRNRLGVVKGISVQALLFAFLHLPGIGSGGSIIGAMLSLLVLGIVLSILYEKSDSLIAPVICHSVINCISTLQVL
jgi:membrane protease YdiL (CAAX protease family)